MTHEQELQGLITFFKTADFPEAPFHLNKYTIVGHEVEKTINYEINQIRNYRGSEVVMDLMFKHLRELKELCLQETLKKAEAKG